MSSDVRKTTIWMTNLDRNLSQKLWEYNETDKFGDIRLGEIIYTPDENRLCLISYFTINKNTPDRKRVSRLDIYDWTGTDFKKANTFELPSYDFHNVRFLGSSHIVYIKRKEGRFLSCNNELWVLNIDDGSQKLFYSKP